MNGMMANETERLKNDVTSRTFIGLGISFHFILSPSILYLYDKQDNGFEKWTTWGSGVHF
jgi:hypothetical protein